MKVSHVHCRVRDLQAAARWFEQVLQVVPVVHNERMAAGLWRVWRASGRRTYRQRGYTWLR